ncbi:MAG: hypothetical protein M3134_05655 [Actinomycetota bacterium]|nr:hypothetical protein [Actinomycetota bacterium]
MIVGILIVLGLAVVGGRVGLTVANSLLGERSGELESMPGLFAGTAVGAVVGLGIGLGIAHALGRRKTDD